MDNSIKIQRHYAGYAICAVMVLVNILNTWSVIDDIGQRLNQSYWFDWLFFNRLFVVLLPIYSMILAAQYKKIKIIDVSLFIAPIVIWFTLLVFGGSGANHMIVNPAMIGCVSGLYLLRFFISKLGKGSFWKIVGIWLIILLVCVIIHLIIVPLPE